VVPHTHPRLLIGMPAPAIREMLHLLRAHCSLHIACTVCVCWLAERVACAARIKALHCASVASPNALVLAHIRQSINQGSVHQDLCSASPSALHGLHLQTTRRRDVMRSSPASSGRQPLAEALPAPLISHMQFVDHDVLLHAGILWNPTFVAEQCQSLACRRP